MSDFESGVESGFGSGVKSYSSCYRYLESEADRLERESGLVDLDRVLQVDRVGGAGGQLSAAEVADGGGGEQLASRRGRRHLEVDDVLVGDAADALHHAVGENLLVLGLISLVVCVARAFHSLIPE